MKYTFLLSLIFSCISLSGCIPNKNYDVETHKISINLDASKDIMDNIKSLQVIHLYEDSQNFPGVYSKVKWQGDSIYILDIFKSKGLYLYNPEGELINSYNNVGQGPDEFRNLSDFIITDDGIILLDNYENTNRIYLDSNLKFVRKEEAEENSAHFAKDNNGGFWYDRGNIAYGNNKDKLVYISNNKRNAILKIPKNLENVTFSNVNSFSKLSNDTFAYLPVVEPYVYKCHNGEAAKWLEFDFGVKWPKIDAEASSTHPLSLMRKIAQDGKIYGLNMDYDEGYLVFTFNCNDKFYIILLKEDNPDFIRLLHIDNTHLEKFGPFLSLHKGFLYFGEEGKITKVELSFIGE